MIWPLTLIFLLAWLPAQVHAIDRGADGKFTERSSMHFLLLEDVAIDRDSKRRNFERQVLRILESAYDRVGDDLGMRPNRKLRAIVYDPGVFDQRFARLFRFRIAGFYDRALRVRGSDRVENRLARTLYHEYTHAAFATVEPSLVLPAWINEGVAEWIEALAVGKQSLSAGERARLQQAGRDGHLPRLQDLRAPTFGHLDSGSAGVAYLYSYATITHLNRNYGGRRLRSFVQNLLRTHDVDGSLRKTYRVDTARLDSAVRAEFR